MDRQQWEAVSGYLSNHRPLHRQSFSNIERGRLNALANEQPVFYGDDTHAMILVQAAYNNTALGPYVTAGWAIDPWPLSLGFRMLQPNELQAKFVGIAIIQDINPTVPVINKHFAQCKLQTRADAAGIRLSVWAESCVLWQDAHLGQLDIGGGGCPLVSLAQE